MKISKSKSYVETDDGIKTLEEVQCSPPNVCRYSFRERQGMESPKGFMSGACIYCGKTHKERLIERVNEYPKLPNGDFDMDHKLIRLASDDTVLRIIEKIRKEKGFINGET
tara:strand:- start:110 stop:442 length:333 start_codon:yes stop_codon:yes gene_type:complete